MFARADMDGGRYVMDSTECDAMGDLVQSDDAGSASLEVGSAKPAPLMIDKHDAVVSAGPRTADMKIPSFYLLN